MALEHRLQILLDEERHSRVASAARRRLLEAPDMPVPEPAELKGELEALRARRACLDAAGVSGLPAVTGIPQV
jgi:hypothetical protein